ncbi:glycosyltransferase involved in cell wall biosynthesis [Rhizobium rhizoryzae]|uniref:Glycosyltransferase involved in cell wall biosynthesis n=2 Tax=Rhizobium rhizoryzae TaxID=451876 RepID=A0A7W6LN84_9HYPH|nr:glycosyltransferase involved in cell wall biosynthesis [Rhizobium rhizoryzae]
MSSIYDVVVHVSHSDAHLASVHGLFFKKQTIINNGFDFENYHDIDSKDIDIIFIGRLHEQKNPLFALKVAQEILNRRILFVGSGPLQEQFEAKLSESCKYSNIEWIPAVAADRALELLARSKILLFPSRWEGFPITPIEAMALGTVVVASDIAGTNEILNEGCGMLIEGFNSGDYAKVIETILDNDANRAVLAGVARKKARARYSRKKLSARYFEIYLSLRSPGAQP